jgi:hypothetical protein
MQRGRIVCGQSYTPGVYNPHFIWKLDGSRNVRVATKHEGCAGAAEVCLDAVGCRELYPIAIHVLKEILQIVAGRTVAEKNIVSQHVNCRKIREPIQMAAAELAWAA